MWNNLRTLWISLRHIGHTLLSPSTILQNALKCESPEICINWSLWKYSVGSTSVHSHSKWHNVHKEQRSCCVVHHNKCNIIFHHITPLKSYYMLLNSLHHLLHLFHMTFDLPPLASRAQFRSVLQLHYLFRT